MGSAHILIVEDENIVAKDIQNKLKCFGYHVPLILNSGEQALRTAAEIRPDLTLMDIRLKGEIDGVEAARQLRHRFGVPVVYLTAFADNPTLRRAKATSPLGYIIKPFRAEELHSTIQIALHKHRDEKKLNASHHQLSLAFNQLEKEVLEISELEKRRVGQELHDNLYQQFTGIEWLSKALEKKLAKRKLPEAADAFKIAKLVHEGTVYTHNLARGLYPTGLQANDLVAAFHQLALDTQTIFHVSVHFEHNPSLQIYDSTVITHLYRIVQEAVHNAVQHGKAKHILITLTAENGRKILMVKDDGVGFSKPPENSEGMGLRNMKYRAEIIGASLFIQPAPDGGILVKCLLRNPTLENSIPQQMVFDFDPEPFHKI